VGEVAPCLLAQLKSYPGSLLSFIRSMMCAVQHVLAGRCLATRLCSGVEFEAHQAVVEPLVQERSSRNHLLPCIKNLKGSLMPNQKCSACEPEGASFVCQRHSGTCSVNMTWLPKTHVDIGAMESSFLYEAIMMTADLNCLFARIERS
jgi:hypothetical protein